MVQVKSFGCGLLPLRTGCIVIVILSLLICAVTYGYSIYLWHWAYAFGLVFELSVWTALLFGTITYNQKMVLASLIGLIIVIGMRVIIFMVVLVLAIININWFFMAIAIGSVEFIVVVVIYVYWGIVIYSFYRSL